MDIINVKDLKNIDEGIEYIYSHYTSSSDIDTIKKVILSTSLLCLPKCYVCLDNNKIIGFLILSYDKIDDAVVPFTGAMSIYDLELEYKQYNCELIRFSINECKKVRAYNLLKCNEYHLQDCLKNNDKRLQKLLELNKSRK